MDLPQWVLDFVCYLKRAKKYQKRNERCFSAIKGKLPGRVFTDLASRESASVDNLRISILPHAHSSQKGAEVGVVLKLGINMEFP